MQHNVLILDFGSQYTNLIARRIREMQVLTEFRSPTTSLQAIMRECPKGIILSGGPGSVHDGQIPFDRLILFHRPRAALGKLHEIGDRDGRNRLRCHVENS